jgi:lipopolysaccharide/colanic/teichoic acid biosynthesis glycosyltransferase
MATIDTHGTTVRFSRADWGRTLLDFSVSLIALLVLSPLLLAIAAAVLLETGRPILFTQSRVGRGG